MQIAAWTFHCITIDSSCGLAWSLARFPSSHFFDERTNDEFLSYLHPSRDAISVTNSVAGRRVILPTMDRMGQRAKKARKYPRSIKRDFYIHICTWAHRRRRVQNVPDCVNNSSECLVLMVAVWLSINSPLYLSVSSKKSVKKLNIYLKINNY